MASEVGFETLKFFGEFWNTVGLELNLGYSGLVPGH